MLLIVKIEQSEFRVANKAQMLPGVKFQQSLLSGPRRRALLCQSIGKVSIYTHLEMRGARVTFHFSALFHKRPRKCCVRRRVQRDKIYCKINTARHSILEKYIAPLAGKVASIYQGERACSMKSTWWKCDCEEFCWRKWQPNCLHNSPGSRKGRCANDGNSLQNHESTTSHVHLICHDQLGLLGTRQTYLKTHQGLKLKYFSLLKNCIFIILALILLHQATQKGWNAQNQKFIVLYIFWNNFFHVSYIS